MMNKPSLPLFYSVFMDCVLEANGRDLNEGEIAYLNHVAQMHEELVEALLALVSRDKNGCWVTGYREGEDVTDLVGTVLAKVEGL